MHQRDIAEQTMLEQEMLNLIMGALRNTIAWKPESPDFSRKLSTILFSAQSFQRHLERTLAVEEYNGYMPMVAPSNPHLAKNVEILRQEHDVLRKDARRIVYSLENFSPTGGSALEGMC